MKKHEVFFSIYGKKFKTTVEADSPENAEAIVKGKLVIHKTVLAEEAQKDEKGDRIKETFDKMFNNVMDGIDEFLSGHDKKPKK